MLRIFSMKATTQDFTAEKWQAYLSQPRLEAAARRKSPRERQLYLGAEVLLNRSLQRIGADVGIPAVYERNEHGKPYLVGAPGLHVNWSHSGEYVICAVSSREVGIDIQENQREPKDSLIRRLLQPEELGDFEGAGQGDRELFYRYWAAKESFLKAVGTGFAVPLELFWVRPEEDRVRIVQRINEKSYSCRILDFEDRKYTVAVCCEGTASSEEMKAWKVEDLPEEW